MSAIIDKSLVSAPGGGGQRSREGEERGAIVEGEVRAARFRAALAGAAATTARTPVASDVRPRTPADANGPGRSSVFLGRCKEALAAPLGDRSSGTSSARSGEPGRRDPKGGVRAEGERRPGQLEDQLGAETAGDVGKLGDRRKPGGRGEIALFSEDLLRGDASATLTPASVRGDARRESPGEQIIAEVAAAVSAAAQPHHSWLRPEGPTRPEPRLRELPQPVPGVDPVHQLLIGKGPQGAEARMLISVGPLAGAEIHLREGPGGVQASVLTQTASSRLTLTTAMTAIAQRLRDKGHRLDVRVEGRNLEQVETPVRNPRY